MAKILGTDSPNIPWQEPTANTTSHSWRDDANPILGRVGDDRSISQFKTAVMPF